MEIAIYDKDKNLVDVGEFYPCIALKDPIVQQVEVTRVEVIPKNIHVCKVTEYVAPGQRCVEVKIEGLGTVVNLEELLRRHGF